MTKRATLSSDAEPIEAGNSAHAAALYVMRLYVFGFTPHSARAIANIRKICEAHLGGHYDLELVDIAQNPESARTDQIIAAPTLIKRSPLPVRRFIGDMARTDLILSGLGLGPTPGMAAPATGS